MGFPGVIGAIDCTHIAITTPSEHEEQYFNHHGYHSINVQVICDRDLRAINLNARFPGSVHDQFIWCDSVIKGEMERLHRQRVGDFFLIGDSGYAPEPWLLTPITNTVRGTPEALYTETHCSARNVIERFFGVLKGKFRCLLRDRTLHYAHAQSGKIIETCVILHNMMIHYRVPFDEHEAVAEQNIALANENVGGIVANDGRRVRAAIVERYFNH
uniref:DDE Tnp4 domain-containing protein n=1 Tax=Timema douglasi TaxID=61478 RepID=A0A7R8VWW8_TIMDO|nr:unnamed protein product [Timema douglasi]